MNAAARTEAPPPDQTLRAALSALARRIGHRGLAIAIVIGVAASGSILWRTNGEWSLAAPTVVLAAFGVWGLATMTLEGWPLPPADSPDSLAVERLVLRLVSGIACAAGIAAGVITLYAIAFLIAGRTIS